MIPFTPAPDVAAIVQALLDRSTSGRYRGGRSSARFASRLDDLRPAGLLQPGRTHPRHTAHDQLAALARLGYCSWPGRPGRKGTCWRPSPSCPSRRRAVPLARSRPLPGQRSALADLLLAPLPPAADDWRLHAVDHTLRQLRAAAPPHPSVG